jgi:hypothetical protein
MAMGGLALVRVESDGGVGAGGLLLTDMDGNAVLSVRDELSAA